MIYEVRVIFGDTDQMGVVYYANYLRYFEGARAAFLRASGRSNKELNAWGVALPVVESHCRYHQPAHYEDLLEVDIQLSKMTGASLRFDYVCRRGDTTLATGYTVHACIHPETGKARRIPDPLRELLSTAPP